MQLHPLANFDIQKYQNESKFNDVYSKNILPRKKEFKNLKKQEIHGIFIKTN